MRRFGLAALPCCPFLLFLLGVASAAFVAGCERGCLASRVRDHGRERWGGAPDAAFDLSGTDCSDGLARCADGRIEVSRAAHVPHPCAAPGASPEARRRACECPWDEIERCASGCAVDGLVVVATEDVARVQLCRPPAASPVARPPMPVDPAAGGVCPTQGIRCIDGAVRVCDGPGRPDRTVAVCVLGCDARVGLPEGDGERAIGDGVPAILCRRDHAERR